MTNFICSIFLAQEKVFNLIEHTSHFQAAKNTYRFI